MELLIFQIQRHKKVIKYLISGCSAAVVNLSVLYVLTEFGQIWYIASSGFAFVAAFAVSFTLQKFWTFGDASVHMIKKQLVMYLVAAVINLGVNTMLMYSFVEYLHLHYLIAQIITSGLLAIGSFFVYQHLIFKIAVPKGYLP